MRARPGGTRLRSFGAVGALVALAVAVVACGGGGDDSSSGGDESSAPAAEVSLEMAGSSGEDPFAEGLAIDETASFPEAVAATISDTAAAFEPDPTTGGVTTTGGTPGLYGGSQEEAVCDVEALTTFLTDPANAEKATAFTSTLGITLEDLASGFLSALTPVTLTTDTLVTNHGFRDGQATPFPAVLQAGTAVLVDGEGVPRVKCNCGNPLNPPPTDIDLDTTTGDPWPAYAPGATTTVTAADSPVDTLTLVDTQTGDTYQQPAGASPAAEPIDLANFLLPAGVCEPDDPAFSITDGSGGTGTDPFTDEDYRGVSVSSSLVVDIDVDGDGAAETVVVVTCSYGPNALTTSYLVIALRSTPAGDPELVGEPLQVGAGRSGLEPSVLSVENGTTLVVEGTRYVDSDANCCPSLTDTGRWVWKDGVWMGVS